jgi:hypothetical protein
MFRMSKPAIFALSNLLKPHMQRQDTKFHLAIPVLVRVAVTLFTLTHGGSLFVCSEMFAVGKSTCSAIMRQTVRAINDCLRHEIAGLLERGFSKPNVTFRSFVASPQWWVPLTGHILVLRSSGLEQRATIISNPGVIP